MSIFVHEWEYEGEIITFSWLGDADVKPDRVYAFAFTSERKMLLVTDPKWAPACWLPGGGIEGGESVEQALARELGEEANATLHQSAKIGTQRAENSTGLRSCHAFYWCRVTLGKAFTPKHEISERHLVTPDDFLDRLFWGRKDPKAPMLLERALEIEQSYESGDVPIPPD
jgi:ADP-ribose pyrophosphatase YjhB (NUDIX family)